MRGIARRLWTDDQGSVAPIVAISLIGLLAVGGVGFDYARLASMHTELQNAADHAALAAASQLDGSTDSCARAAAAAASLLSNKTYFANDNAGTGVQVPTASVTDC